MAQPRPVADNAQQRERGQTGAVAVFLLSGTRDVSVVVARRRTCMREFWMRSQKSASAVEPGVFVVDTWYARPSGKALMVRAITVMATRAALHYVMKYQLRWNLAVREV